MAERATTFDEYGAELCTRGDALGIGAEQKVSIGGMQTRLIDEIDTIELIRGIRCPWVLLITSERSMKNKPAGFDKMWRTIDDRMTLLNERIYMLNVDSIPSDDAEDAVLEAIFEFGNVDQKCILNDEHIYMLIHTGGVEGTTHVIDVSTDEGRRIVGDVFSREMKYPRIVSHSPGHLERMKAYLDKVGINDDCFHGPFLESYRDLSNALPVGALTNDEYTRGASTRRFDDDITIVLIIGKRFLADQDAYTRLRRTWNMFSFRMRNNPIMTLAVTTENTPAARVLGVPDTDFYSLAIARRDGDEVDVKVYAPEKLARVRSFSKLVGAPTLNVQWPVK